MFKVILVSSVVLVGVAIVAQTQRKQSCVLAELRGDQRDQLIDSMTARSTQATTTKSSVTIEQVVVEMAGECIYGASLTYNSGFDGGVIIFSQSRGRGTITILDIEDYPGAHALFPIGSRHIAFTYSAGRGSGFLSERVGVLCALADDNWVPCFDIVSRQEVGGTGYQVPVGISLRSTASASGDTLVMEYESTRNGLDSRNPIKVSYSVRVPFP